MGTRDRTTVNVAPDKIGSLDSWTWYDTGSSQGKSIVTTTEYITDGATTTTTMNDVSTPNYKARSARGEIINNPMTKAITVSTPVAPESFNVIRYTTSPTGIKTGFEYHGLYAMSPDQLGEFLSGSTEYASKLAAAIDIAVTSAHANTKVNEAMILATVAEANKSIASMGSIMYRVLRIARAVKHLDVQYLRRQISYKELQDRWMEARYALRPLMYDARQIAAAMDKSIDNKTTRQTSRGFESVSVTDEDDIVTGGASENPISVHRKTVYTADVRAGVLSEVQLSNTSVWGADLIVETAWELVPLSFVFDWFWNIGKTLSALTPSLGIKELASWVTVFETVTQTNSSTDVAYWDAGTYQTESFDWSGTKSHSTATKTRTVNPALSLIPRFDLRLNASKLIDLVIIGKRV